MRRENGITLIALMVTLAVLIALLVVSTKVLVNSDIIGHSEKTGQAFANALENDKTIGNNGVIINGKKYANMEEFGKNNPMSTIKMNMAVTYRDTDIPTDETKYTLTSENVPIPAGYYYVGGTKNTGVVISDNANDKDKGDDHSVSATLQGNQFVWVPVLQNQKIKIDVTAEDTITSVELLDPTGTEITTPAPTGKTYTESVEPTRNGQYKLTVKTANETRVLVCYVPTLYAQDEENKYYIDNADTEEATVRLYKNSVNKYGGFFIARYEAGCDNIREYGDSIENVTVYSQANKYPFNWINRTNSITKAKEIARGKTSVTAGLINGATWDRTLNWILETNNNMSLVDINEDCTSWGNFWDSKFNFTGKYSTSYGNNFTEATTSTEKPDNSAYLLGTGVTDYTRKNNIYDLAGNCYEWTTEFLESINPVARGGSFGKNDFSEFASSRTNRGSQEDSTDDISFRPSLYINL